MLQDALDELKAGADVVVGIVETHGRPETEHLLVGLPIIPRRQVSYRGVVLEEMNLDAVLERCPQIALVDELAHTNAPGSRHPKRYHDVEELLARGISVYSTLNVQHLESRADVVRQITGIKIRETVPDSILDQADDIQVVDITPDDLRERLAEGKVYLGESATVAAHNFFRPENLTALREMTLRIAAEHTDSVLRDAMRDRGIPGPWKVGERLMVSVGTSPYRESLIRMARRAADGLDCPWMAVYVETDAPLGPGEQDQLTQALSLARRLGGEVLTVSGQNVAQTLLRVAREHNVTQIIVGKSNEPWWISLFHGGTLVQQLIRHSGLIDVYVVQADKTIAQRRPKSSSPFFGRLQDWLVAVAITVVLTVLFIPLTGITGYSAIAPLYLLWVVIAGLLFPRAIVVSVAASCAILWNYFFIPPQYTLVIGKFHDVAMFLMFFVVAVAIGQLTTRLRASEIAVQKRERRTSALLELARQAALAPELDAGLEAAVGLIETLLHSRAALTLRTPDRTLFRDPHPAGSLRLTEKERGVAAWVYARGTPAGRYTETLPDAEAMHLPLQARTGIWGVLSIKPQAGAAQGVSPIRLFS
jgi:two-component system sensor histidine kinase KdpD